MQVNASVPRQAASLRALHTMDKLGHRQAECQSGLADVAQPTLQALERPGCLSLCEGLTWSKTCCECTRARKALLAE